MMEDKERHLINEFGKKLPNLGKIGKIGIKISDEFAKTRQGQILLWTICNLTCRLKGLINEAIIIIPKNIEYSQPNYIPYNNSNSNKLQEVLLENIDKTKREIKVIFEKGDFNDNLDAILLIGSDCSTKAQCSFIKKVTAVKWFALIGDKEKFKEISIENDKNPFGALTAGCLGVGELFKYLGKMEDDSGTYLTNFCLSSYDFSCYNNKTNYDKEFLEKNNPNFPNIINLNELVLVGSGAVGHAFVQSIYVIEKIRGKITIIDREIDDFGKSEKIESTNLARYIIANNEDLEKSKKAELLAKRLDSKEGIHTEYSDESFQEWSNAHTEKTQHIISCVDNNKVRHKIQEKLPKNLHGGSNQDLRVQVSRYNLLKNIQCLKCYNSNSEISDKVLLEKLAKMESSERRKQCEILGLEYEKITEMISNPKCGTLEMNSLKKFVSLWQEKDFSVNFVSTLSGILLASEIIKIDVDEFQPILDCSPYSDLFFSFWEGKSNLSITQSNPECWCNFGKTTPRMIYKKTWEDNYNIN